MASRRATGAGALKDAERERKLEKIRGKRRPISAKAIAAGKKAGGLPHLQDRNRELRANVALREADEGGITRAELREQGFVSTLRHSDLQPWGYQIVVWTNPRRIKDGSATAMIYEYAPMGEAKRKYNKGVKLHRMTASTVDEQDAVHRTIGVASHVVAETQGELF